MFEIKIPERIEMTLNNYCLFLQCVKEVHSLFTLWQLWKYFMSERSWLLVLTSWITPQHGMFPLFHSMHHLWHELCQLLQPSPTQMTELSNYITANQSSAMELKCLIEHYVPHHNQALQLEPTKCYKVGVLSWSSMLTY